MIFAPFLKKTDAYLNRHPDLETEKADAMIGRDVIRASSKLLKLLRHCLEAIIR